jgi:hypothetical protein
MSLEVARNGHADRIARYPVLEVERKTSARGEYFAFLTLFGLRMPPRGASVRKLSAKIYPCRGSSLPELALFGPRAMSDLSPQCAPKRTSPDRSEFMMGWTPRRRHRCAKVEVLSTT